MSLSLSLSLLLPVLWVKMVMILIIMLSRLHFPMPQFQPRPLQYWNRKWLPKPLRLPSSRQLLPGGSGWWVWSCGRGHWLVYAFRFALEDSVEKLSTSAVAIATPLPPSDDDSDSFYSLDGESMDEGGKEGGVAPVAALGYSHEVVLSNGWVSNGCYALPCVTMTTGRGHMETMKEKFLLLQRKRKSRKSSRFLLHN